MGTSSESRGKLWVPGRMHLSGCCHSLPLQSQSGRPGGGTAKAGIQRHTKCTRASSPRTADLLVLGNVGSMRCLRLQRRNTLSSPVSSDQQSHHHCGGVPQRWPWEWLRVSGQQHRLLLEYHAQQYQSLEAARQGSKIHRRKQSRGRISPPRHLSRRSSPPPWASSG